MNPKMENKQKKPLESKNQSKTLVQSKAPEIRIKSQGKVEQVKAADLKNNDSKESNLKSNSFKDIESILVSNANNQNSITNKARTSKNSSDALQSYGTGKRKNAIARVWIKPGSGKLTVNKKVGEEYFTRKSHMMLIFAPLAATKTDNIYDIVCTVKGGGSSGQAGAIQHGVARALNLLLPDTHLTLRQGGFLTRDSRVVERKKYGQPKARKNFQFSKR